MDREKLNKAAEEYNKKLSKCRDVTWNDGGYGFIAGADWLMQQPLSDRLTDEEKEKIREEYNLYKNSWNDTELTETTMESFVEIFGAGLFKEC